MSGSRSFLNEYLLFEEVYQRKGTQLELHHLSQVQTISRNIVFSFYHVALGMCSKVEDFYLILCCSIPQEHVELHPPFIISGITIEGQI